MFYFREIHGRKISENEIRYFVFDGDFFSISEKEKHVGNSQSFMIGPLSPDMWEKVFYCLRHEYKLCSLKDLYIGKFKGDFILISNDYVYELEINDIDFCSAGFVYENDVFAENIVCLVKNPIISEVIDDKKMFMEYFRSKPYSFNISMMKIWDKKTVCSYSIGIIRSGNYFYLVEKSGNKTKKCIVISKHGTLGNAQKCLNSDWLEQYIKKNFTKKEYKKTENKDFQRKKCYRAEWKLYEEHKNNFCNMTEEEIISFAKKVFSENKFPKEFPKMIFGKRNYYRKHDNVLSISDKNKMIILHELSHAICEPGTKHGPVFIKQLMNFYSSYCDIPVEKIKKYFDECGVKYL